MGGRAEFAVPGAGMTTTTAASQGRFGTFAGVFTPSLLTILGVIMYLRLSWVVGEAGMLGAIAIMMLAHAISLPTALSIASLASNRAVGGGGVYYIISRSLGLPVGASIGGALSLAIGLGISLHTIGFAESLNAAFDLGGGADGIRLTGTIALVALTAIAWTSAAFAMQAQYVILAAIALSVASLALGDSPSPAATVRLWPPGDAVPLEQVFAIVFPAVTGFSAGVAMSGDLKDPLRSIPLGTVSAVLAGLGIYVGLVIFFSMTIDGEALRHGVRIPGGGGAITKDVWGATARWPSLVLAGLWGAALSSAIGSLLGAPRILQALALDGVGPRILARGAGPDNEPRIATIATFVIAEMGILVGDLNIVARVLTMFFLTTYGVLNLACALESWANPDFRPSFRIASWLSVIGAIVCFGTMFKVDAAAMVLALGSVTLLYLWVKRRSLELDSADIWAGIWQSLVRSGLYRLRGARADGATWRPHMLLFGGHPGHRPHLLRLAQWIVQEHGLLTNFTLLPTERRASGAFGLSTQDDPQAERAEITDPAMSLPSMDSYEDLRLHSVFHTTRSCPTVAEGITQAAHWYGLVGMEPNAAMLGWPRRAARAHDYARSVETLLQRDLNVLLLKADGARGFGKRQKLDVWWGTNQVNGGLMLIIAHFIQRNAAWARARVRVVTVVNSSEEIAPRHKALRALLAEGRVHAEVVVMDASQRDAPPLELLRQRSAKADLVVLGLQRPGKGDGAAWAQAQEAKVAGLPAVLFVSAASAAQGGRPLGLSRDAHLDVDTARVARETEHVDA